MTRALVAAAAIACAASGCLDFETAESLFCRHRPDACTATTDTVSGGGASGSTTGGSSTDYDGRYLSSTLRTYTSGTTSEGSEFVCTKGTCEDEITGFKGKVSSTGSFTGTLYMCNGCDDLTIRGQFHTSKTFELKGADGALQAVVTAKRK